MYIKLHHNYELYKIVNQTMQAITSLITKPQCEYQTYILCFTTLSASVRLGFQNTVGEWSTKDCYIALFFP